MLKHIQGRTNSIKCENMVALICLLRPQARTAQKAVPHGGWHCHITLKLGRNCGNPGFKATSWQEVRQAKQPSAGSCYSHQQRQEGSWHAKPGEIQQLPRGQASCGLVFMGLGSSLSCKGYGNSSFLTLTSRFSTVMQLKALKSSFSHDLESYQKRCSKCTAY